MSDLDDDHVMALNALNEVMSYYRVKLTPFATEAWVACMEKFGARVVKDFLLQHMMTSKWPPTFEELHSAVGAFGGADWAFERVACEVKRVGPYRAPDFGDAPEITYAIAEMGGWAKLCAEMPAPEQDRFGYEALQKRFALHYQSAKGLAFRGLLPDRPIRGLHALSAPQDPQAPQLSAGGPTPSRALPQRGGR